MNESISTTPKKTVSGGIIIGRRGPLPMAITDDGTVGKVTINAIYNEPQISGFPRRMSQTLFRISPVNGFFTGVLAAQWQGAIPGFGCSFWLKETWYETPVQVVAVGTNSWAATGVRSVGTAEIVQYEWDTAPPGDDFGGVDITTGAVTQAEVYWILSFVYRDGGKYYLCTDTGAPDFLPSLNHPGTMPAFPADFDTVNPL